MKSWLLRVAIAVALLALVGVLAVVLQPAPKPTPMPSPNGYDDFVAAAAAVPADNSFYDFRQWTAQELAARIASSSNVFVLLKAGLQKQCRAPVLRADDDSMQARMDRLASFKRLAYALVARGQHAALEGRTNELAGISLDGVQFAHGIARGGVLIEALVGIAVEAVVLKPLADAVGDLDAPTARAVARRLVELDREAPTEAEALAGEREFTRSHGFYGQILVMGGRLGVGPLAPSLQRFDAKWAAQATRRRELILKLARRAFEVEKGRFPAKDEELVPDYLSALPVLPSAGATPASSGRR